MAIGKKTGGRAAGTPNRATADVKAAAQAFVPDAISTLAEIMRSPEQPAAARVSAANALLDRAHGKPAQSVEVDATVQATISRIERQIVRPSHPNG